MTRLKVKPFPLARLEKVRRAQLDLARALAPGEWLQQVNAVADSLGRRAGLGAVQIRTARIQVLRMEDLRRHCPGRWRFAVLGDPVSSRAGFLALDPLLCSRLENRLSTQRAALPGWLTGDIGTAGLVGWLLATGLDSMSGDRPWLAGWRFMGLAESVGELARCCPEEDALACAWLSIEAGGDSGFAAWLEAGSSLTRKQLRPRACGSLPDRMASLVLSGAQLMGGAQLTLDELQILQPGDLVLLDEAADDRRVEVRFGAWAMVGRRDGTTMFLEGWHCRPGGAGMASGEILEVGARQALPQEAIASLPVELVVEAGRLELQVQELTRLQAGDVVTLAGPVLGLVDLRTRDRLVARGELVDVEGRRGVRVLEVAWRVEAHEDSQAHD